MPLAVEPDTARPEAEETEICHGTKNVVQHPSADPSTHKLFTFFVEKHQRRVRLARLSELLCLLRPRKVAVVPIVFECCGWCSWRRVGAQHFLYCGTGGYVVVVAAVRVVVVHVAPRVEAAAVVAVLTVIVVVPVVVVVTTAALA